MRFFFEMASSQADAAAVERAYQKANLYRCLPKPWLERDLIETMGAGPEIS